MRVIEKNNWEKLTYYLDTADPVVWLEPDDCRAVIVRLPSGTEKRFEVDWRKEVRGYPVRGTSGTVSSMVPWITIEYEGLQVSRKLKSMDVLEVLGPEASASHNVAASGTGWAVSIEYPNGSVAERTMHVYMVWLEGEYDSTHTSEQVAIETAKEAARERGDGKQ